MPDQNYQLPRDSTMQGIVTQLQNIASRMSGNGSGGGSSYDDTELRTLINSKSTVVANPQGTPGGELTTIRINDAIYEIVGSGGNSGSSSGGSSFDVDLLYHNDDRTIKDTITLSHSYADYDFLVFEISDISQYTYKLQTMVLLKEQMDDAKATGHYIAFYQTNQAYVHYIVTDYTTLTKDNAAYECVMNIYGVKVGSGSGSGGSGSDGLSLELICEQATIQSTQTLTHSMDNYDAILVNVEAFDSSTGYQSTSLTVLENISVGKNIGVSTENGVVWFTVQSMSSLSLGYHSGDWRNLKIYGIKFGSGSSSSQEEYSTTENVIGTWIDEKPLYQKTFAINVHTDGRAWVDTGCVIPNIEHIIDWSIVCNDTYVSGAPANIKTCSFRYYNNNIQIYGNTEWYLDLQAIIVKYTKTTD